jgi:hypothetical protein
VQCNAVQYNTVQYSTVQCNAVKYSAVQCSTVQYSTVQYSTVQYSTVQYSRVQYSTVQCSAVQCRTSLGNQLWHRFYFVLVKVNFNTGRCETVNSVPDPCIFAPVLQLLRLTEDTLEQLIHDDAEPYGQSLGRVYLKKVQSVLYPVRST